VALEAFIENPSEQKNGMEVSFQFVLNLSFKFCFKLARISIIMFDFITLEDFDSFPHYRIGCAIFEKFSEFV